MEIVKVARKPRLRNPYLIAAWPGMGEVAFKAASYLVEKLNAQEFAFIRPEKFFHLSASVVTDGLIDTPSLPQNSFYYWRNPAGGDSKEEIRDVIIFLSNAQPELSVAQEYVQAILSVARMYEISSVISLASMPAPIDHLHYPEVWMAATSASVREQLSRHELNLLSEGQISGMNGLFLGLAKREGFKGFCLLGEIPLYTIQIENPKASLAILNVLSAILDIPLDLADLKEHAHTMEAEISKLMEYFKSSQQGAHPSPIGEDEIEKIKKALSQLTRLPVSIQEKIERLFCQSDTDPRCAFELKQELDKWNVYKEYEDRFLDIFKKKKKGQH